MAAITDFKTAASALIDRFQFFRQAGITFGGKRDTYEVLGYERVLTIKEYRDRYARGGLAGRIVDVYPNATWRGDMELVEDEDPKTDTAFEKAWKELEQRLKIKANLQRVDKLSQLGYYAVLLLGGPGNFDEELPRGAAGQLSGLFPFSGGGGPAARAAGFGSRDGGSGMSAAFGDATIQDFETDAHNPRFGLPLTYMVRRLDVTSPELQRPVHWSRIIHVAEGCLDNEVYGTPRLERVWNLLDDLDKVTGGGAEAFWLRANQGLHINIDKDMKLAANDDTVQNLRDQVDAWRHGVSDRAFKTRGVEINTLGSDTANFTGPADAIITQIAGALGVPKRILTGSEMGELASSQDRENWKDQVNGRQTGYVGPFVVRPLVDRLIQYGYLPTPTEGERGYEVRWPHIQVLTEDEKAKGAKEWAATNQAQGEPVFLAEEIRDHWYDLEPFTKQQQAAIDAKAAEKVVPATPFGQQPTAAEEAELVRVLAAAIEAGNADVVDAIVGLQHKYGSTQVQLPRDVAARLLAIGRAIPDGELAADGRETDAHVTVKYGLLNPDASKLFEVVARRGPASLTLGKTGVFQAPDYDVVFVSVASPDLVDLNAAIGIGMPCVPSDYGFYSPHATIAYVKPGLGVKYAGLTALEGVTVTVNAMTMTDADGNQTEVSLLD